LPGADELLPLEVFLSPTPLTHADAVVRDFAEDLRAALDADPIDGLHALSHAVAERVAYRPESTDVETTAAAALTAGSGVCQDQAHVFTAAARYLGIPTRYVSGYFHAIGEGIGEAASHAWSESWVEGLGWVAFDVTNEICASDGHVRLAVGPDYDACAPIRGVRRGGGTEQMDVKVTVAAQGQ
jgi:transglutaminase-like putative cysteine protease